MELNGWTSPQMLRRYGASARAARVMDDGLKEDGDRPKANLRQE
jgi:hypothetical protein